MKSICKYSVYLTALILLASSRAYAFTNIALHCSNTNGGAVIANTIDAMDLFATPFTISLWFTVDSMPDEGDALLAKDSTLPHKPIYVIKGISNIYIDFGDGVRSYSYNSPLLYGCWYHFAFTYNNTTCKWYMNGSMTSLTNVTKTIRHGATLPFYIGTSVFTNSWPGMIDEVSIWTNALSQTQISSIMTQRLHGSEGGLIGYWNFDSNQVADMTGNNQPGTLRTNSALAKEANVLARIRLVDGARNVYISGVFPGTSCGLLSSEELQGGSWSLSSLTRNYRKEYQAFIETNSAPQARHYRAIIYQ